MIHRDSPQYNASMNIFLSHARDDDILARDLAKRLRRGRFRVWDRQLGVEPGENWAKKTGEALDAANFMVFLLTPTAYQSDLVRSDIAFALMSKQFAHRVFSVMFGAEKKKSERPSILELLPHRYVKSADDFDDVVKDIKAFFPAAKKSAKK